MRAFVLFLIASLLAVGSAAGPEKPEPSYSDLVIAPAEWKQKLEPNYRAEITGAASRPAPYPRWLPGPKGTQLEFRTKVSTATTFVLEIGRAHAPSAAVLLVDGKEAASLAISRDTLQGEVSTTKDGLLGTVDQEAWCAVPAGNHTVTVMNLGPGWIEIPSIRIAGFPSTPFHMERKPVKTVEIRELITITAPALRAKMWGAGVGLFPSDDGQTLHDLKITAVDLEHSVEKVKDRAGQEYFLLKAKAAPGREQTLSVQVVATVTLYSRTLVRGAAANPPVLDAAEKQRHLEIRDKAGLAVLTEWIQENDLERRSGESELDYAQRGLNVFRKKLRYKWVSGAAKGREACIRRRWGGCDDLNGVLVDLLKLAGIPARTRPGRSVTGDTREFSPNSDLTLHVAAEFWAEGIGWVPIEGSAMTGKSLQEGGPLRPYLGIAKGEHVNKHYDDVYPDRRKRTFQLMDFPFCTWEGSWAGWTSEGKYGYRPVPRP